MKITLREPTVYGSSCGITAISILTGLRFSTIKKEIIKVRLMFPRNSKGFRCERAEMTLDTEWLFVSEIAAVLRGRGFKINFKKHKGNYISLLSRHPKGTFLVHTTNHISILRDEKVWDNTGGNCPINDYLFKRNAVICYSALTKLN